MVKVAPTLVNTAATRSSIRLRRAGFGRFFLRETRPSSSMAMSSAGKTWAKRPAEVAVSSKPVRLVMN
jgi:hypothetical protein